MERRGEHWNIGQSGRPSGSIFLVASLAACAVDGVDYRGKDHAAFSPVARAQWLHGQRPEPADDGTAAGKAPKFGFRSTLAAGATWTAGDFARGSTRPEYQVGTAAVAWQPEITLFGVCFAPAVGLGYGSLEVDDASTRADTAGLGLAAGSRWSYRGLGSIEPYLRYDALAGVELRVRRFEAGLEWHATSLFGLQFAYFRQTATADEIDSLFGGGAVDTARIATDGVHLGLSLRF